MRTARRQKQRLLLAASAALFILAAILIAITLMHRGNTAVTAPSPSVAYSPGPPLPTRLEHIFVIMDENKDYSQVIGSSEAPYLNSLAQKFSLSTNFGFETHPSLPNYIALTSGSTQGITTDCNPPGGCQVNALNLADELERAGIGWKQYGEDMPSPCASTNKGEYATKHIPFLYYSDILTNQNRCKQHIVPLTDLGQDLAAPGTTPGFAFITPNICNDVHDCSLATGDDWLAKTVPQILSSKAFSSEPSLLVITFDESDTEGNIATVLAGPSVKQGYQDATTYDHYSLLRTIEDNWGLPPMTSNDANATPMLSFFK